MKWIAVDWGTSRLRAWSMDGASVSAEAASDDGMATLAPGGFEAALIRLIDPWLLSASDVYACGMVGAKQGWVEAPYRTAPCPALASDLIEAPVTDPRLSVHIAPGVAQSAPPDVMRGEETQIAGFLALNPKFDGILCLPGSHSKWVHVSAGEVVSFQTFLTGEMFAALSGHTVLRHTTASDDWDEASFAAAVSDALSRPEKLATGLFPLRAEAVLGTLPPASARARLSGLLIGMELAAAKPYWLGQSVAVIGNSTLARRYVAALAAQGLPATQADGAAMTLKGLCRARQSLKELSPT